MNGTVQLGSSVYGARVRAAAALAVAFVLVAGCSHQPPKGSAVGPAPSTTAPLRTTTTIAIENVPQPTPQLAAAAMLEAWGRGDRVGALRVASAAAVDSLFARPPSPAQGWGCQEPVAQTSDCAFGLGDSGLLVVHTKEVAPALWVVDSVSLEG